MIKQITQLEKFILEKMSETKMVGLSIALLKDGEIVYSRGFGFSDLNSGIPTSPKTLYGIGSITKSFTALAIMKLVNEGKISLDDPVDRYISVKLRPFGEPVTIHHLLCHSSGIPSLGYAEAFIDGVFSAKDNWLPVGTPDDVITFAQDAQEWAFTNPGKRFFYSNCGYVMLGKIISLVSNMRYEDYIKENIFKPLGMDRSFFSKQDVDKDPDVSLGYIFDPSNGVHVAKRFPYGITSDGGIISNTIDLCKYLKMYIVQDEKIVPRGSLQLMLKPYAKVPWETFGDETYGYGWIIHPDFLGQTLIEHGGSVLIFTGFVGYVPEKNIGVAILANSSGYALSNIGMYALTLLMEKEPEENLFFIKQERILKKLEGIYHSYKRCMSFNVKRNGDFLFLELSGRTLKMSVPFIPQIIQDDFVKCFTLSNGRKNYAEFYLRDDRIELIYERYKLVKESWSTFKNIVR